jgi:hypothetical protein
MPAHLRINLTQKKSKIKPFDPFGANVGDGKDILTWVVPQTSLLNYALHSCTLGR